MTPRSTTLLGRTWRGEPVAVDIADGRIARIRATDAASVPKVTVLPGLHDHHVHLRSASARSASLDLSGCGTRDDFARAVRTAAEAGPVRAIGYDDTRVGELTRRDLDGFTTAVPVRVQHRGGHLWVLNSPACARVAETAAVPADGRFWNRDADLAASSMPVPAAALRAVVGALAARGVVAVDDMTPALTVAGAERLRADVGDDLGVRVFGACDNPADGVKIVLGDDEALDPAVVRERIARARPRPVAVHSVTAESLVTLFAADATLGPADRIEHAFVTPSAVPTLFRGAAGGPSVGVHPGFLRTHGDRHREHGSPQDVADYLRMRSWARSGATLLGGTDAPYSVINPWQAMQAAVDRRTASGVVIGGDEAITPEEAFTLFRADGWDARGPRLGLQVGDPADICVIEGAWEHARNDLSAVAVVSTMRPGRVTFEHAG